jgi:hypothetical protein
MGADCQPGTVLLSAQATSGPIAAQTAVRRRRGPQGGDGQETAHDPVHVARRASPQPSRSAVEPMEFALPTVLTRSEAAYDNGLRAAATRLPYSAGSR